jgi:hypothetical protein
MDELIRAGIEELTEITILDDALQPIFVNYVCTVFYVS